jgi:DNA-binding CsgD family transcriptional regulator
MGVYRSDVGGTEQALLGLTDAIYDAAAGPGSWSAVGDDLLELFGARSASIMVGRPAAGDARVLYHGHLPLDAVAAYRDHYRTVDLWTNRAAQAIARAGYPARPRVWRSGTLVSDTEFLRGEFYADFGRRLGLRYVVGTVIPIDGVRYMPIGLHRPAAAGHFDAVHVRMLERLVPHLRRAMLLGDRLAPAATGTASGLAALDALATGVVVVDADLRVLFVNGAAETLAGPGGDGAYRFQRSTLSKNTATLISANHKSESASLAALVRTVALHGAPGGAVGLRDSTGEMVVAALVAPLPSRLVRVEGGPAGRIFGQALILLRDIRPRRLKRPPGLLADLFGLTQAESEVALALVGGATKEVVAVSRGARVTTVRTQVRAVLAKTGASNLRDLERILATLT